ncbi:PTS transporter subunit IIABC [Ruminococcus bicirculans (ex Wegman et al. 2014)]|uniref:PTS transporter subunit IIABC n=1 Tax=Ruminococcus bicirculans (ex Wegman et al. 2014) TaxID=1160721 RepID=UPI00164950D6|nr:PTS transporter subunit IIABC [Ruminococcus bicirculans (ex Wegman et al. 2014)]MBC3514250.1 PTS transporter subunit EIIC [Ruminococcus bicirculans (ex Wegman et al. 2014)]
MKDKIFGVLQRVGRSFMLPIALLPVAGLLLGIGSSFTNATTIETYHLGKFIYEGGVLYTILDIMSKTGSAVFDNLALLFAMGVAIGMAKKEKEVAALSGAIAYIVMNTTISALITAKGGVEAMAENSTTSVLGITTLQMGVFGGILVGLGVAALHNKFYKTELPQVLSFFGGTRFVPIVSTVTYLIVGIIMFYLWPIVQLGISKLGVLVLNSGYAGTWIYGILERALIPFGLHHVFYMPFWQTELGGSMMIDGNMVAGAQNIFFAELASKSTEVFSVSATRFMAGKFPFMIFGLPAAAFAMYKTARPEKKKIVGSLLLSAALTSMITGITEPLEFTFLFVAPLMYAVHCVLAGLSYMLMHILNVGVGMTFSGGLIDMTLFGILQGNEKTHWIWIVVVGLIYAVVYYFVFYFMITKMNLKTPGREPDDVEPKLYRRSDVNEAKAAKVKSADKRASDVVSAMILKGLGGKDNLSDVDCCATRLRVTVNDASKVMDDMLKASGASGIIHKGNGIQVIYGPKVSVIKSDLEDFIDSPYSDDPDSIIGTEEASDKAEEKPQTEGAENTETNGKTITLYSHMNGTAVKLEDVEDEVFSQKILGEGAAVEPSEGKLYAPCDGKIDSVFDTKHAVNMVSDDGVEILLHIGIDTVKLGGQYFEAHVSDGQEVKKGDLLISFDMDKIKAAGYKVTTPIIIGNTDDYASVEPVAQNSVSAGDMILKIK